MALPHKTARQDPVTRGGGISIVAMTLGDVVLRQHPEFPQLESRFTCKTLAAEITPSACKANFQNRHCMSCQGCRVGAFNAGVKARTKLEIINDKTADRHTRSEASRGLHCVRCGRSSASSDFVGNMRLVRSNTCCVSCYNREREVKIGENSKGAKPVLHCGLRPTTLVIKNADGKRKTVDIGMSTGPSEARRHAERRQFELLEIWIDGARGENAPDLLPEDLRKQAAERAAIVRAERKKKPLRIANDREAAETEDKPLKPRKSWLPPMTPEQAADYEASFEDDEPVITAPADAVEPPCADESIPLQSDDDILVLDAWAALELNPELGLAPFINWLTEDWPESHAAGMKATPATESDNLAAYSAADGDLTWAGKTIAHWSESTGMSVDVLAANMVRTGSPFAEQRTAIRPPPVAPVAPSEPVADANAQPEIIEPVVQAAAQPQRSKKWLAKQAARAEREARKAAAEKNRVRLPQTKATQGAITARGMALVAQFLNHKIQLT
ncbi:hypothetical protein [Paraburkholderia haematera]|uniref:Uncharacterized protein n=1 Tax=Paraburkholderia haematera TaxID=2793077 RepID=A0ABM8QTB6_9BURK|nr:hypothetical protein [Paraburkholderia haematera]CAE6714235.1 hypothetical protein R69888_01295 [Paraburkholderia haematera]